MSDILGIVLSKHCFKQVSSKILLLYNKDSGTLIFLSDLQTVTERLHSGYYSCVRLFHADMKRVFPIADSSTSEAQITTDVPLPWRNSSLEE